MRLGTGTIGVPNRHPSQRQYLTLIHEDYSSWLKGEIGGIIGSYERRSDGRCSIAGM